MYINLLNTELNPICHFLASLGARHILHISRIRVKELQRNSHCQTLNHNAQYLVQGSQLSLLEA